MSMTPVDVDAIMAENERLKRELIDAERKGMERAAEIVENPPSISTMGYLNADGTGVDCGIWRKDIAYAIREAARRLG